MSPRNGIELRPARHPGRIFLRKCAIAITRVLLFTVASCASSGLRAAESTNAISSEIPPLLPPHPLIPPTFLEQYGTAVVLLGILVLAGLSAGLYCLFKPRPQPPIPPEQEAHTALQRLRRAPETGLVLSQVSQTVRHYFARAFKLASVEMTTSDFARELNVSENVGPELREATVRLLRECDERKFAPPAQAEPLKAAERAEALVEQAHLRKVALSEKAQEDGGKS